MQTLPEHDQEVTDGINSSTLAQSAALCADCNKWFPTRKMFWDNRNLCEGCKNAC